MSRSILLQLARDSIAEVLQAQRTIDKELLLQEHPLLNQKIATHVSLYIDNELRGSAVSKSAEKTLLEDIIYNAKRSAFENADFTPLSTSEYLHCEVEVTLITADGVMKEKDKAILQNDNTKLESIVRKH